MGRAALLTALAVWTSACAATAPAPGEGHSALACAACHQGGRSDRELASVPDETCTQSACHTDDVPGELFLETVRFQHRGHGSTDGIALGCAGCHSHENGQEPISGSADTCGICHQEELASQRGEACRVCHAEPSHDGITAQGLAVPHKDLPWIERGCLRCHYEVAEPLQEISTEQCATCHHDLEAIQRAGVGVDLHASHVTVSCQACHDADTHRIASMSSAVNLVCAHCHTTEHSVEVDLEWLTPATCVACHRETHQGPQALFLGIAPSATTTTAPAEHFMDGLTCRSCHANGSGTAPVSARPTRHGDACTQCHRAEYRAIPQWWADGVRDRLSLVDRYVTEAERAAARRPGDEDVRLALATARARLDFVRLGDGSHNLPLTHRLLEDALAAAAATYAAAGQVQPFLPSLGRPPRSGFCSYCHYQIGELGLTEDMPEDFHREVVR